MNRKVRSDKKRWLLFLCPVLAVISVVFILFSPAGFLHLCQLQREYRKLVQENSALEKQNRGLYQEIMRLRDDPIAIEDLARKELGLVKEGELIFQFVPPADTEDSHAG